MCAAVLLGSCGAPQASESSANAKLTVAAAANLMDVFGEVGQAFQAKTGVEVIFSYGSTAQLATQIDNGAPFDVFAAADTEHVDSLVAAHKITSDSRAIYALGQLALWIPEGGPERRSRTEGPGRTGDPVRRHRRAGFGARTAKRPWKC